MSNVLLKFIKFGIGFILFIPLYVGGSFFFPFIFPKIWLFQLVVEILAFLYIVLSLSDARYRPACFATPASNALRSNAGWRSVAGRPKYNLIFYALLVLTVVLIITSFTGIDVFRSFWGNTERMSGVIAWLHFAAFAVILSATLKTKKEWENFFAVAAIVSSLEFFYVLAQHFGASFTWLPGSNMGTIGNTDLLGTYAIFSAFFALYLWSPTLGGLRSAHEDKKFIPQGWGMVWAAAFFLNIGTLYFASSRGAILGFGAGIFAYLLIETWRNRDNRKIIAAVILAPAVLYGFLFFARSSDFVKKTYQLNRVVNFSLKDDTIQQRFTEWGIAWSAFKARPIFGWGPNNYLYLHNAYLNPHVYILRETNFDRAHNAYLDYASMSGVLGLVGYLFLIAGLFWVFAKSKLWVFASLMIAYAVQSISVFDSPASYIALFLTIGFAMRVENLKSQISRPTSPRDEVSGGRANLKSEPISAYAKASAGKQNTKFSPQTILAISIFYFLFSIFLIYQASVKPALANLNFVRALSGSKNGDLTPDEAFDFYRRSLKYETLGTTEFRSQFNQWIQMNVGKFPAEKRLEVVDFGIGEQEKEVADHPMVFSYMNLGFLYYFKAININDAAAQSELFKKSARAYDEAIKLSPKRLEVYYSYLQLAMTSKDYGRGVEVAEKIIEIAPDYAQNWWFRGIFYLANGKEDEAVASINHALALWYSRAIAVTEKNGRLEYNVDEASKTNFAFAPKREVLGVVSPYIKKSYFKELLLLYLVAAAEDQKSVEIHQSLALTYDKLGLEDKASEELKIIERLSAQNVK